VLLPGLGVCCAAIQAIKCTAAAASRQAKTTRSCGLPWCGALPIVAGSFSRWTRCGRSVEGMWTPLRTPRLSRFAASWCCNGKDRVSASPPVLTGWLFGAGAGRNRPNVVAMSSDGSRRASLELQPPTSGSLSYGFPKERLAHLTAKLGAKHSPVWHPRASTAPHGKGRLVSGRSWRLARSRVSIRSAQRSSRKGWAFPYGWLPPRLPVRSRRTVEGGMHAWTGSKATGGAGL
jgi:hypothetical protein